MFVMVRLCLLPLALAVPFPTPPEQTQDQIELFERISSKAKEASEAATPTVLDFFNSDGFRSVLRKCCPIVAELPSVELLQRYRAEARAAEIAHALPAQPSIFRVFSDVLLKELGQLPWFPNEFQVALMHHRSTSRGASRVNDKSQTDIFGCRPFAGSVPTWSEASSRLIYAAHNMRQLDSGSAPFFGDVIAVFNTSRIKEAVVVAPHDTGLFTMICFHPEVRPPFVDFSNTSRRLNCSAWPKDLPLGTLEYLDHLILPNLAAGANRTATNRTMLDAVRDLFTHSGMSDVKYENMPAVSAFGEYLESNILANPRLPEAIKFLIGSFPSLFGTRAGEDLQAIAKASKWPLFWALGDGNPKHKLKPGDHGSQFYKGNHRIADPDNIAMTTNASATGAAVLNFQEIWQQAADLRAFRHPTLEDVHTWWESLEHELRVGPIAALSCADLDACVAVDLAKRDCICVVQNQPRQIVMTV